MHDREIEQSLVNIRESLPRLWWAMYQGCLQAGFDEQQAFTIIRTYVYGMGRTTTSGHGPDSDLPE